MVAYYKQLMGVRRDVEDSLRFRLHVGTTPSSNSYAVRRDGRNDILDESVKILIS